MLNNKIKKLAASLTIVFAAPTFSATALDANATIDVYGTNRLIDKKVATLYQPQINTIVTAMQNGTPLDESLKAMTDGVKSDYHFSYVNISPIMYQHDKTIHITIDVVEQKDKQRLAYFLPKPTRTITDPEHLIDNWLSYQKTAFDLIYKQKQFPTYKQCPAYHCIFGFEHPALQKFAHSFDDAEKYKSTLIDIIRHEKDDEKRAAAVYVLAHIKNSGELVNSLLPAMHDSSALVRNNAMRVIAETLEKNKINIPINQVITALDFPNTTDRNKALLILYNIADRKDYAKYIATHATKTLINILKLQQPNNHDFSYNILKRISGKNYGERDYHAWTAWAKQYQYV